MSGIRLSLTIDDSQLRIPRERLEELGGNLRPLMEIAGGIFENSTRARFAGSYGPDRIPWPATWAQRVGAVSGKTYGPVKSNKPLVASGSLLGSIRSTVGDNFVETGPDGRSKTSRLAHVHQDGMTIRPRRAAFLAFTGPDGQFHMVSSVTIPARPFMGIDREDIEDLTEAFVDYLEVLTDGH